ncbi:MAG TPA: hypothetical protein VFJ19_09630 [Nocardioidaceae bacterium]|nr:hypothetical protein [Nocardioidaceae bacterium]
MSTSGLVAVLRSATHVGEKHPVERADRAAATDTTTASSTPRGAREALAAVRVAFGLTFLWAFFDKLLALGWSAGWDPTHTHLDRFGPAAWIHGGSPTEGYLKFAVSPDNWFQGIFGAMAGQVWVDWLFMAGLLGIGVSLTLGVGMRVAAVTGTALYLMMWVSSFPLANHPFIDEHLLGALTLVALAALGSGRTWGFERRWSQSALARRFPVLR